MRHVQSFLSMNEDVVPKAGFEMGFHFWQIEVRAVSTGKQFFRVMKEVETEVVAGWPAILMLFVLAQVFLEGKRMREDLGGTV